MTEKFYASPEGAYLGVYVDGATPPVGAIEVPSAPERGDLVWGGNEWASAPPTIAERIAGVWAVFDAKTASRVERIALATLADGPGQAAAIAALQAEHAADAAARDAAIDAIIFGE